MNTRTTDTLLAAAADVFLAGLAPRSALCGLCACEGRVLSEVD
jgi:hypothetical protein